VTHRDPGVALCIKMMYGMGLRESEAGGAARLRQAQRTMPSKELSYTAIRKVNLSSDCHNFP
jgi:hypothetical protein